jgi:hypothetical protein
MRSGKAITQDDYAGTIRIPHADYTLMLPIRPVLWLCYCFCIVIFAGNVHAEIYRWVDENGIMNYTQRKPANVDATLVRGTSKPRTSQISIEENVPVNSDQSEEDTQLNLTEEQQEMYETLQNREAERQEQVARIRVSNCKRSKALLARLTANSRISIRSSDGDQRNLPDEERTQRIGEVQRSIATNCDPT